MSGGAASVCDIPADAGGWVFRGSTEMQKYLKKFDSVAEIIVALWGCSYPWSGKAETPSLWCITMNKIASSTFKINLSINGLMLLSCYQFRVYKGT